MSFFKSNLLSRINFLSCLLQKRGTVWPSNYKEPIQDPSELQAIKENDEEYYKNLAFSPIKALHCHKNNSVFFDQFFFNLESNIMVDGKRNLAKKLINETLFQIKKTQLKKYYNSKSEKKHLIPLDPKQIIKTGFENCKPILMTKLIKRGGASYQVPYSISEKNSTTTVMEWIRKIIRHRAKPKKIKFPEALAKEMLNAYNNEGKLIKKKNDIHKLCEANKAYAHYRWT